MLCPVGGMHLGKEQMHCPCRGQQQPGCLLPLTKGSLGVQAHPPAPCSSQTQDKPNWDRGDYCSVHTVLQLPPGCHPLARTPGEENGLSVLCASMHQGGGTDADILVSDFLAAQGTAASTLRNTGQPPWCGRMNPGLGKACPQEKLLFPDAPLRWSGSLPAHSCAHPATSRLEASLWLAALGGSKGRELERQLLAAGEEQPGKCRKVQPACRKRRDWGLKGKTAESVCRGLRKGWKHHGQAMVCEQLCRQEEHPLMPS